MATRQEIEYVHKLLHDNNPKVLFDKLKNDNAGVFATLRHLSRSKGAVRAKDISEELHVSTARISVILRKLSDRGFISKVQNEKDGRSTLIEITESGQQMIDSLHTRMDNTLAKLIDEIGVAEIERVFLILGRIRELSIEHENELLEESGNE